MNVPWSVPEEILGEFRSSGLGEEGSGLAKIPGIASFGDSREEGDYTIACRSHRPAVAALDAMAEEGRGRPELEHRRSLTARDLERTLELHLDVVDGRTERGEELRAQAADLGLPQVDVMNFERSIGRHESRSRISCRRAGFEEH